MALLASAGGMMAVTVEQRSCAPPSMARRERRTHAGRRLDHRSRRPAPRPAAQSCPANRKPQWSSRRRHGRVVDAPPQGEQQPPGIVRRDRRQVEPPRQARIAIDQCAARPRPSAALFRASHAASYHAPATMMRLRASKLHRPPAKALDRSRDCQPGQWIYAASHDARRRSGADPGGRGCGGARDGEPCRARQSRPGPPPAKPGSISSAASRCSSSSSPTCRSIPGTTGSRPASGRATPPRCSCSAPASPRRSPSAAVSGGTASPSAPCASLHRCWQVYWSHLGLFLTVAAHRGHRHLVVGQRRLCRGALPAALLRRAAAGHRRSGHAHLRAQLFRHPAHVHRGAGHGAGGHGAGPPGAAGRHWPAVSRSIWRSWHFGWDLPAEWWSDRPWFFDPFGWQLIFFTGFAFGSGWLPEPPRRRGAVLGGAAVRAGDGAAQLAAARGRAGSGSTSSACCSCPFKDKTHFGILRYLHFLALAYVALWLVNPYRHAPRRPLGGADRAGRSAGAAGVPVEHEPGLRAGHGARRVSAAPGSPSAWPISAASRAWWRWRPWRG